MAFDKDRKGTGTKEWSEHSLNIQIGCSNDCLYCYAADNAAKRYGGWRKREEWHKETLTPKAQLTTYPKKDGVVMFPTTHDITPYNIGAYIKVALAVLAKGNDLLIVTKPSISTTDSLIDYLSSYRDHILFRATIGSMDASLCKLWEPGAPPPQERLIALRNMKDAGFETSVSIEPMLAGTDDAEITVNAVAPYVTETIWIGKMNDVARRVPTGNDGIARIVHRLQSDAEIMRLHTNLNGHSKVRWKDSIKKVVGREEQR